MRALLLSDTLAACNMAPHSLQRSRTGISKATTPSASHDDNCQATGAARCL